MTQPTMPPQSAAPQPQAQPQYAPAPQPPVARPRKKSGLLWLLTFFALGLLAVGIVAAVFAFSWLFNPTILPAAGSSVQSLAAGGYVIAAEDNLGALSITNDRTGESIPLQSITGQASFNEYNSFGGFVLEESTAVRFTVTDGSIGSALLLPIGPEEFAAKLMWSVAQFFIGLALVGLGGLLTLIFGIWALIRTFARPT